MGRELVCDGELEQVRWIALSRHRSMDPLVLFRTRESVVAAEDRCPHRNAPLSAGIVTNKRFDVPIMVGPLVSKGMYPCTWYASVGDANSIASHLESR